MPDKPATVAAYAAGASLAAITLFYVFGPTFFIDGDGSSNDGRKRTIVGLSNAANDCFMNSVLQALAGLGDLRLYLIKELHRRELDGGEVFETLPLVLRKGEKPEKVISLQKGPVTRALKDMLDALNERPIYKKTITAKPMIEALERAFQTRISRNQQDAQEFLQIVLERLSDEYHAAEKARKRHARQLLEDGNQEEVEEHENEERLVNGNTLTSATISTAEGFPFEGRIESQIQCMYCGFRTKPTGSTFVSLTLNVPQKNAATLDNCFDILLKTEDIDDYMCDKCRLKHALEWKQSSLAGAKNEEDRSQLKRDITRLEKAIVEDPEKAPEGVILPESRLAPRRKIKKHMRITVFPKVIAIHLSRSVYDPRSYSTKNLAKVSYTERLRLGGILNEHWYRLLGLVCHKGTHNSGHYESFRRNHVYPPFSTPDAFSAYAAASRSGSTVNSAGPSPAIGATVGQTSTNSSTQTPSSASLESSRPSTAAGKEMLRPTTSNGPVSPKVMQRTITSTSRPQIISHESTTRFRRKKKSNDRWWRVSDDKVKEAHTSEVLGMQREVYLLFYELERPGDSVGM